MDYGAVLMALTPVGLAEAAMLAFALRMRKRGRSGCSGCAASCVVLLAALALSVNLALLLVAAPGQHQQAVWVSHAIPDTLDVVLVRKAAVPRALLPGTMVVKVAYAALNPIDYQFAPLRKLPFLRWLVPQTYGLDGSGVVHEANCDGFKAGDAVFGAIVTGSAQEFALAPCALMARVPLGLSMAKAAASPGCAATAYDALADVVKPGSRVLVIGAAGGCGSMGVALAKSLNAAHVACVASEKNRALATSTLGCDAFYAYDEADFESRLRNELARKVDVAYDTVSGPFADDADYYALIVKLDLLSEAGTIRALLPIQASEYANPLPRRTIVNGSPSASTLNVLAQRHRGMLDSVLVRDAGSAFDIDGVRKAVALLKSRRATGKLVLKVA